MAYSKIVINFTSVPLENQVLNFYDSNKGINLNEIFKNNRAGNGQCDLPFFDVIDNRWQDTISNLYKIAVNSDYNNLGLFTVTSVDGLNGLGSVTITATYDNAVFSLVQNGTNAAVTITNSTAVVIIPDPVIPDVLPDAKILSRSPYNVTVTPPILFDQIIMNLYLYKGHKTTSRPVLPNYTLSKIVVYAGQPKIAIEISKIANDFIKNNYTPTLGGGSQKTSLQNSTWIYAEMTMKYLGNPIYYINQTLYALDGFGYHTELANPTIKKNVLSSISNHVFYNGSTYPLYFLTNNLTSISVNGINVPFAYNQSNSNEVVGMVNVGAYASVVGTFNAVFTYSTGVETHTFEVKDECKYQLINCTFKNKFGFWQNIPFNKLSKKSIDFESQDFMPIVSSFGTYALNSHNKKTFLSNGKEKVTVNTDYLREEYNELFKELMLSEFVYLEENGQVFPVNIVKKTFEKKTKLINKLIQYSMDFEYSFNLMNTVI